MIVLDKNNTEEIINIIKDNRLIIMKTDTVYGIMALANKDNELKINRFKNSLENKKISIIFKDVDTVLSLINNLSNESINLIKEKLPGKYTFIVNIDNYQDFDRNDFGIRVTSYPFLQDIIAKTGPLLASSCNKTGTLPCTNLEEIKESFKDEDICVVYDDEGSNTPSTIIDIRDNNIKILR